MFKIILNKIENNLRLFKHLILNPENEVIWLKSFDEKFDVSIDAGANRGYVSSILSKKSKEVISLEPLDYLAEYLKNVLPLNCTILKKAASNKKGTSIIKIPRDQKGNDISALSSIEHSNNFLDSSEVSSIREVCIEKITLDEYIEENFPDRSVDFLKIDVEGHEEALLDGARKIIQNHLPIVLIEMEHRHGSSLEKIYNFFIDNNYYSYYVKRGNLKKCDIEFFKNSQIKNKVGDQKYISDMVFIQSN
jgi:FkbM family methyltransferase